ncbi:matrixin family metalloprotease [Micromonospora sp. KC721]|uniref:matrixin family metalloprotease n=1 Tax=Micromonospora sp. KC721 TaxID=2530380 RepID=UPI0014051DFA|nr:matrixin family metalloprotease [Micromonospora sp. KC721]
MNTPKRRLLPWGLATLAALAMALGTATPASADDGAGGAHADVLSITENADGTVVERLFRPAPGVTPAQLAQLLTESGVPNVVIREDDDITAQAAACKQGTARTWASSATCFVKWAKKGNPRPVIHFLDRSSAKWPVGRAVTEWNKASGIDSIYRAPSAGCASSAHCVEVVSANYGASGWMGETVRHLNAARTYHTHVSVYLNDHYHNNESVRWETSCHELGHVLGLGHNTSKSSCLYAYGASDVSKYPNSDDRALITRFY